MSIDEKPDQPAPAENSAATSGSDALQSEFAEMMNEAGIDRVQALDTALRIIVTNRMCEEYSGLSREQMLGQPFFDIFPEARAWPAIEEAMQQALQGRRSFVPAELGAYEPGHHERHFMPLRDADGKVRGVLYIIHDVAHRVAAEDRLKALNGELAQKLRELQRANAELATFTHVTSHDLKEPLRKIYTFVELTVTVEHARISDKGRSNLRRVQSSVQRLGLLTDDLVSFAEASAEDDKAEDVCLTAVFSEALAAMDKIVQERSAIITVEALPTVHAPRRQIVLLANHLLSNALKFHDGNRTPRVSVRVEDRPLPGSSADGETSKSYVCIATTDNGIGIDSEYHEKIFTIFQRLHDRGTYPGTGIGLAICRKIVERLGGTVTVESTPGAGSTFRCWLPSAQKSGA